MKPICLTLLFIFLSVLGWSQHFYSRNYTVNDGLPSNTIRSIHKDSKGVMWIGTGSGLCSFDGKAFKIYGTGNGLAGENVFSITEDKIGNIWIGCMKGGISMYDGKKFTAYTKKQGLVSDNVRVVWYSHKFGLLFIGTNDGCSVFDGKSFISYSTIDTKTPDYFVMGFWEGDDFVNIYPYRETDYLKFCPKTKSFKLVPSHYYPDHPTSTSPVVLSKGDTAIGSLREGINILNEGIKKSFKGLGQVFDIKQDGENNLWIAAWSETPTKKEMPGGIFKYNGQEVLRYSEKFGINDPTVWSVYYDTTFHLLWVGTLNSGIYKIPLQTFEWFDDDDFGLKSLNVKSLFVNNDNSLWVGTKGDLFYRRSNGNVNIFNQKQLRTILNPEMDRPLDFACIQKDNRGNIYAGIWQSPLVCFSSSDGYRNPKLFHVDRGATQFCFDSHDTLYYGDKWWEYSGKGYFFEKHTPKAKFYWFNKDNAPPNVIKIISSGDTIWYCSLTEGLFRSLNGKFDFFRKTDSTLPRNINDICFDHQGNVVVGSNSGEVLIVRYENNGLKVKFRLQPGKDILGNSVKFMVADRNHQLFVGTNLGLNRIDLQSLYKSNKVLANFYNSENGYYDYTGKVATTDEDGNIWVGTDSHLLKINTKLFNRLSSIIPQIKITGLDVNYQLFPDFETETYFTHDQNNLIFHFESDNYLNPEQTLYRYKLNGLSDRWSDFTSENKSAFTSLNPGKYCLIVESYNTIDNSKIGMAKYPFRIGFPWYLKWWFIALMIVTLGLLIWFVVQYRTEKIRQEEKKKTEFSKQLAEIEMKALQSQMNPHFIFNCINSIQGFILKNKVDEALGYLMDFSKILRQTLDNASREYISLDEEIDYIKCYLNLETMRFRNKFSVNLQVPDDINPNNIEIPPMIIQPYVENSIRHGLLHKETGAGLLTIRFKIDGETLICCVEDNGVGRKKSREIENWKNQTTHKPQSTRITKERIDLLNMVSQSDKYKVTTIDLYDDQGIGIGTRVEITLPLMIL